MEKEFVSRDLFDGLAKVVETMKETVLGLSARCAAQDVVIRALLETATDQQSPVLRTSIRNAADDLLAIYDDEPHGQGFRALVGKHVASLLSRLDR